MTNEQILELSDLTGALVGKFIEDNGCSKNDVLNALEYIVLVAKQTSKTNRL